MKHIHHTDNDLLNERVHFDNGGKGRKLTKLPVELRIEQLLIKIEQHLAWQCERATRNVDQ